MTILCVADSTALPRSRVHYADTWISLLKKKYPKYDFICNFQRAATSRILVESGLTEDGIRGADTLEFYSPQIVILQLGIVDCSPRYLTHNSILFKVVKTSPQCIQNIFWKIWKTIKKRSIKKADVLPLQFLKNIDSYLKRCVHNKVSNVIIIKIATPSQSIVKNNPLFLEATKHYNGIYDKLIENYPFITVVDPLKKGEEFYYVDGYHPAKSGHELIFEELDRKFIEILGKC